MECILECFEARYTVFSCNDRKDYFTETSIWMRGEVHTILLLRTFNTADQTVQSSRVKSNLVHIINKKIY